MDLVLLRIFFVCLLLQIFYESFDESFEGSWIVSEKEDYKGIVMIKALSFLLIIVYCRS